MSHVQFVNISTRGQVDTGDKILVGGFVIPGDQAKQVLIRAVGPALTNFGVSGVLEDPVLTLYAAGGAVLETNTDWGDSSNPTLLAEASASAGAFAFEEGSKDAAIYATLNPGAYTAHVSGNGDTTGVALVEVYGVE